MSLSCGRDEVDKKSVVFSDSWSREELIAGFLLVIRRKLDPLLENIDLTGSCACTIASYSVDGSLIQQKLL